MSEINELMCECMAEFERDFFEAPSYIFTSQHIRDEILNAGIASEHNPPNEDDYISAMIGAKVIVDSNLSGGGVIMTTSIAATGENNKFRLFELGDL